MAEHTMADGETPPVLSSVEFHHKASKNREKKVEGVILRKQFTPIEIKKVSDSTSDRLVEFIISTEDNDRYGDIVQSDGWELNNYKANPTVLFGHQSWSPPIGRAVDISIEKKKLRAVAEFMDNDVDTSGFSDMIYRMVTRGFLKATSVGFLPMEYEWMSDPVFNDDGEEVGQTFTGIKFTRQELLEFSVVPVPANPFALVQAKSAGINLTPLEDWFTQALDGWTEYKKSLLLPKKDVEALLKQTRKINKPAVGSLFTKSIETQPEVEKDMTTNIEDKTKESLTPTEEVKETILEPEKAKEYVFTKRTKSGSTIEIKVNSLSELLEISKAFGGDEDELEMEEEVEEVEELDFNKDNVPSKADLEEMGIKDEKNIEVSEDKEVSSENLIENKDLQSEENGGTILGTDEIDWEELKALLPELVKEIVQAKIKTVLH